VKKVAAHQHPAQEAEHNREGEREIKRAPDERGELAALLDVAADKQNGAIGQAQVIGTSTVVLEGVECLDGIGEFDPALALDGGLRQRIEIAGKAAAEKIREQIDGTGSLAAAAAHGLDQSLHAALRHLLAEGSDLRAHGGFYLPLDEQRGVPIDISENSPDGEGEDGEIKSGEAKGGGL
jgi:hypothetical protein